MTDERYVPGLLRCPKCNFILHRNILYAQTGAVAVDRSPTIEACPNEGEIMEQVTWKDYCEMNDAAFRTQVDRAVAAEAEVEELEKAVAIHKQAIDALCARDSGMLGVRNDLQARVAVMENALRLIAMGRTVEDRSDLTAMLRMTELAQGAVGKPIA